MEGNKYWQEWYKYNTDCQGNIKVHHVRMDAPNGSGVILTDDQYLWALKRRTVLDKLYQNRLNQYSKKFLKQVRSKRKVDLCMICNERFLFFNDVRSFKTVAREVGAAQRTS